MTDTNTQTPPPGEAPPPGGDNAPPADWRQSLSDDFKGHASLEKFPDLNSFVKSHIELEQFAGSRFALPKDGDAASFDEFAGRLRPADAADYRITVPEGDDGKLAESMRPLFHKAGLHPQQAAVLVDGWNAVQQADLQQLAESNRAALQEVEASVGTDVYNRSLDQIGTMLTRAGIEGAEAAALTGFLEKSFGPGPAMRALMKLAEGTAELAKVDGDGIDDPAIAGMSPESAQQEADRLMNDSAFIGKAATKGTVEHRRWHALNARIAAGKKS